jgi:hypothetical protein
MAGEEQLVVKQKLRAIRRLSTSFPARTAEERLVQIEGIASGNIPPTMVRRAVSPDMGERLARGQASRSPRNALDKRKPEAKKDNEAESGEEKKRKRRSGFDRKERGGIDRSDDLNV